MHTSFIERGNPVTDTPAPVQRADRIGMLDMTRGIAVLGILLMNIVGFGLPDAYEDPTNWGGHQGANLWVWRIASLFFEGTMRGLFTFLFGAGALLFLTRNATASASPSRTRLYYRRTLLLIAFGLFNGYVLLWEGDILFYYGVTGLFLYFFRNVGTRALILIGLAVLTVPTIMNFGDYREYKQAQVRAEAAQHTLVAGENLSFDARQAIEDFEALNEDHKPSSSKLLYAAEQITTSYASAFRYLKSRTFYWETTFFAEFGFAECLGMMLLGMALLKTGVLSGNASGKTYGTLLIAGYATGLAVNVYELRHLEGAHFAVGAMMDNYLTYDLGRVPMTLGHVGLIGLLWQTSGLARAKRTLAYVGQMALTNYLTQSAICMFIFTGAGLGLFGELQRYQLYYVVAAIWIVQLAWSPWWLKRFQFGPVEWVWRTLTYGHRQPLRIAVHSTPLIVNANP
ncbi:MAG: DUF418 domain-containing protein [Povalibacter sp.]